MAQENQPEKEMEQQSSHPQRLIPFEQAGEPKNVSGYSPGHAQPGLGGGGGDNAQRYGGPGPTPKAVKDTPNEYPEAKVRKKNEEEFHSHCLGSHQRTALVITQKTLEIRPPFAEGGERGDFRKKLKC